MEFSALNTDINERTNWKEWNKQIFCTCKMYMKYLRMSWDILHMKIKTKLPPRLFREKTEVRKDHVVSLFHSFKLVFQSSDCEHVMKVIQETCRAHLIWYLHFHYHPMTSDYVIYQWFISNCILNNTNCNMKPFDSCSSTQI